MKGTREALAAVEKVLAAMPVPKAPVFDRILPALVERHLVEFGLEATGDPLRYRFGTHPEFELRFVPCKRHCVPVLCRVGGAEAEGYALGELRGEKLDEDLAGLASRAYNALPVQWPLFLAVNGEVVPGSELVASLQKVRWQVCRIAEAAPARPEVIQTCVDFLLSGVWDDVARENLIRLVEHTNCPLAMAERLASHTSRSLQKACADRLKRD